MLNWKTKAPPLYMPAKYVSMTGYIAPNIEYIPSSGVIVSVKLRRSAGSGKFVFIVGGRSSSVKSEAFIRSALSYWVRQMQHISRTFLHSDLGGTRLRLLLGRLVLILLHAPDLDESETQIYSGTGWRTLIIVRAREGADVWRRVGYRNAARARLVKPRRRP